MRSASMEREFFRNVETAYMEPAWKVISSNALEHNPGNIERSLTKKVVSISSFFNTYTMSSIVFSLLRRLVTFTLGKNVLHAAQSSIVSFSTASR